MISFVKRTIHFFVIFIFIQSVFFSILYLSFSYKKQHSHNLIVYDEDFVSKQRSGDNEYLLFREYYGFTDPFFTFKKAAFCYFSHILTFDFGTLRNNNNVAVINEVVRKLFHSLFLFTTPAILILLIYKSLSIFFFQRECIQLTRSLGFSWPQAFLRCIWFNGFVYEIPYLARYSGTILTIIFVVEVICKMDGFGSLFYDAILARDYNVILCSTYVSSLISLFVFFVDKGCNKHDLLP